ncbi:NAD(P)/FAD-dependent oxidoreductase [Rhodoplanes sp. Z2-YC6860]|uniref:NAD(P)/FAD-dependent oxidoreductase n=1 Tax=Rhodoplanes sp. Z2-YC6860 TaxID=674703 RepID=UPI00078E1CCC|nr:FAD-binding oxidoreductase [Rhodoplanes sp. Z2-YC6860]AMN40317.1 glycine/D-amino acid oxidase, deaminating [Rhodoplanes sp. Z2-YC6860]
MVTKSKDLRTGRSVWEASRATPVPHRRLTRDIETEVLVVGAGITGAIVADALSHEGFEVAVVDRRGPAKGSTTASTALVQYEIDTPLHKLARRIGRRDAIRAWRRSRLAVDAIAARLGELGVRGLERRDTLYLAGNLLDADGLARERDARLAAGFACRMIRRSELRHEFGIHAAAAIMSHGDLALDPRLATCALLRGASACGARIYAPVDVSDIDAKKSRVLATCKNGRTIRAKHLVLATGYEFPNRVPQRGHRIVSTWAIATARQPRRLWPSQCMIWEAADPYLYARTTPDGRVICGGEDEDFSDETHRDALIAKKTRALERKLHRLVPGIDSRAEFAWTGSFGQSAAGLPTIGPIPGMPNCWAALGYGGNGTTYSRIAADVICGALTGRPDVDADLYGFRRARR